ncbi:MAG: lipoyl(octanoyl) transferase LipB [Bacteroidota bacterium]|nr:lipoyl(octanoyl) transferase LipB [Bacteroidota bacterium]
MNKILTVNIGRTRYADAWELQRKIFSARVEKTISDVLLFTEHDPVYTLGKGADENHVLANDEELREKKIDLFHIDRGGDVTFHGPGQIVGYPILDLSNYYHDIHRYLRDIEEVLIRVLSDYGIHAERSGGYTGVWVKDEKIAAIGVKVSRWVTMHGFAFNVATDLSYFDRIIPCGIFHKGVTSLQQILQQQAVGHLGGVLQLGLLEDVEERIAHHFGEVFGAEVKQGTVEGLNEMLSAAEHMHFQTGFATEEKLS